MLRKILIVAIAAVSLGAASLTPTAASAGWRGGHHWGHGGHWGHRWGGGHWGRWGHGGGRWCYWHPRACGW